MIQPVGSTSEALESIERDGFAVLHGVADRATCDAYRADLLRLETALGIVEADNGFEGRATRRVYNLLRHGPMWQRLPVEPSVLEIVEGVLDAGCLLSSLSSVDIGPGETPQPIHADDALHPIARPHPATVCNSMWALTDFTEANGATRIIPGTHRADAAPVYGRHYDSIAAEMPAGSVLVWHGSLWHGGGANATDERRVGIAVNYCAGWIRQQENQQLGLSPSLVAGFDPRLRELVGYGIYSGLIGHIERRSPAQVHFGDGADLLWDRLS